MKSWTTILFKHFKLKQKLFSIMMLIAALVSTCATHEPKISPTDASCDNLCPAPLTVSPKIEEQIFAQENWSFKLVGSGWTDKVVLAPQIKVAKFNNNMKMSVLFLKEETGDVTYQEYVTVVTKAFLDSGTKINALKQVMLSNRKAILMQLSSDIDSIWVWILMADGFGYGLTCGGKTDINNNSVQFDFCQSIADSLQIK